MRASFVFNIRRIPFLSMLALPTLTLGQTGEDPLFETGNVGLKAHIESRGGTEPVHQVARRFLRQPVDFYFRHSRDPARQALEFDLAAVDRFSFLNQLLAVALATSWDEYFILRTELAHQPGGIYHENSNFFLLSQWVPSSKWLLADVTRNLYPAAEEYPVRLQVALYLTPQALQYVEVRLQEDNSVPFSSEDDGDLYPSVPYFYNFDGADRRREVIWHRDTEGHYIPKEHVASIEESLRSGDVLLLLSREKNEAGKMRITGPFAGFVDKEDVIGLTQVIGPYVNRVRDTELRNSVHRVRLESLMDFQPRVVGVQVLRVRSDVDAAISERLTGRMKTLPGKTAAEITPEEVDRLIAQQREEG